MRNKKGDMTGQIFVFLLAIILFGLILIYGYKAVKTFGEKSEETSFIEFKDNLQTAIRTSLMDYGSVKKFKVNAPLAYEEICFIDLEEIQSRKIKFDELANTRPLIYNAIESGTDQNVFLVPMASTPIKVEKLDIDDAFLCFQITSARITLRLEGKGNEVGLSRW